MSEQISSLRDLVELALVRNQVRFLSDLERIAARAGYKIVATTLSEMRRGSYRSQPTRQTLEALAYLAGVTYEVARDVAGRATGVAPGAPSFVKEVPPKADILSPAEREALLHLIRVMINNRERIQRLEREAGVSGVTEEDLQVPDLFDRSDDSKPQR